MELTSTTIKLLTGLRLPTHDEKALQSQLANHLAPLGFQREYRLDAKNIPDFFLEGVAIEVKIKGGRMAIYRQCERYCKFDQVKSLILITNRAMGLPTTINDKPVYLFNLGKAWL